MAGLDELSELAASSWPAAARLEPGVRGFVYDVDTGKLNEVAVEG